MPASASLSIAAVVDQVGGIAVPDPVLIKAGIVGGKGIPTSVAGHPAVFVTLTAPSFGPVHTRSVNQRNGKVRPCRMRRDITRCPHGHALICTQRHTENAPSLGRPLCLDCYPSPRARWQWCS